MRLQVKSEAASDLHSRSKSFNDEIFTLNLAIENMEEAHRLLHGKPFFQGNIEETIGLIRTRIRLVKEKMQRLERDVTRKAS